MNLEVSFFIAPKSVHCTAPVTSDVDKNLWKMHYFSIVLPNYLQTTMGRGTKVVSPLTTERAQKTRISDFQISPPYFGKYSSSKNILTKRWELEQKSQ